MAASNVVNLRVRVYGTGLCNAVLTGLVECGPSIGLWLTGVLATIAVRTLVWCRVGRQWFRPMATATMKFSRGTATKSPAADGMTIE